METYLYFRKFRPATFTHENDGTGQALTAITGLGGDDIDDISEVASLVVIPKDAANSNIGSAYSHPGAGGSLTLSIANGAVKTTSNSVITLNNNSEDTDSGYTLEDDDQVVITLQQGAETSFMYPASSLDLPSPSSRIRSMTGRKFLAILLPNCHVLGSPKLIRGILL